MGDGHDPGRPSPEGVTTLDALCARLRELRAWAGNPSFSRIADAVAAVRAARGLPAEERPGRVTVYECFQPGRKRIDVDLLIDIVAALGADRAEQARWRDAHRCASSPPPTPPKESGWRPPAELPADIAGFTGRERELAALTGLLGEPGSARAVPVCVVSGIGGIGKTAVALRAAHDLAPRYPDGQLFADLTTAQPAQVLAQFLVALGVDRSVVPDGLEERAALYRSRSAGRRVLVVLDNAPAEAVVRPLVPGAGTCGVVVTSRSRLPGLAGVHRVDVGALPTAAALALLRDVTGDAREWDEAAAREVVRLCDRMPLAIRIAGARLARRPDLRLARFAERLADRQARLDLLTSGDTGVRACFDLTCAELGRPAQRVFLFAGLLGLDTIACWTAAVAAGLSRAEAELAIDELVDARLFTAVGTDPTGEPRFGMHDLIRLYAAERAAAELAEDDRRAGVERAVDAWLALARAADHALPYRTLPAPAGPSGALPAIPAGLLDDPLTWFEAERAQLRAAIVQACRDGWAERAWRIADACAGFYEARERYDDWDETHSACLAACPPEGVGAFTMARNLAYRYSLPVVRGAAMAEHARRALAISEAAGLADGRAEAQVLIAVAAINRGAFDEATELADAARGHAAPGSTVDLVALSVLGLVHRLRGDLDAAAERFTGVLAHARGGRHNAYELVALRTLAIIRRDQDRHAEAAAILADGLRLTRVLGVRASELLMLIELGEISALAGLPDADAHLSAALALAESMSSEIGAALAMRAMSTSDLLRGDPATALDRLTRSLAVQRKHGLPHVEAHTLRALGTAQTRLGDHESAARSWQQARAIYAALGNGAETAAIDGDLAALAPVRNREAPAAEPGLASSP